MATTMTAVQRLEAHALLDREDQFWHEHWAEYLAKYPESFVAIKDGQVFMTDVELGSLLDRIEAAGLKPWDTWVRFFSNEPRGLITGFFEPSGLPYPFVRAESSTVAIENALAVVNFLIDTGSAHTCINPVDANLRLKIPKSRLRDRSQWSASIGATGVGGPVRYFVEPATLTFANDDGSPEVITTDIWIAEMTLANQRLPSLLGWDVLRYFRLVTDGVTVTLDRLAG